MSSNLAWATRDLLSKLSFTRQRAPATAVGVKLPSSETFDFLFDVFVLLRSLVYFLVINGTAKTN